jgi:hypothetical protein
MPKVPYSYEVTGKLDKGNGSLIPICSSSKRSLLPSLTAYKIQGYKKSEISCSIQKINFLCDSISEFGLPF